MPKLQGQIAKSIRLVDPPPALASAIRRKLTKPNPLAAGPRSAGQPAMLEFFVEEEGALRVPRGALGLVQESARALALSIEWDVSGVVSRADRPPAALPSTLRDYQREAVRRMLEARQGWVQLPCGGGKTVLGSAAIAACGEPSLVLVHTHDLVQQWVGSLRRAGVDRIRTIGGDASPLNARFPLAVGEVAVATVQSLSKAGDDVAPMLRSVGAVLLDEAHHLSADTFLGPVSATASRYRWGLTATPDRPDGMGFLLDLYLGPRLFSLGPADLVARGYLVLPQVYGVSVNWTPSPLAKRIEGRCPTCRSKVSPSASAVVEGTAKCKAGHPIGPALWGGAERIRAGDVAGDWDWAAVTAEQFSAPVFLDAIVDLAEAGWREDRTVLVLVPLVDAAERVVSLLRRRAVPCAVVTGAEKKSSRERRLSQVRGGHLPVIVATQLADEGLDVPNLDLLVLASGGRAEGRAIQRVGRVMRPQGAPPVVFDLVTRAEVHLAQWRKRADAYRGVVGAAPTGLVSVADALSSLGAKK